MQSSNLLNLFVSSSACFIDNLIFLHKQLCSLEIGMAVLHFQYLSIFISFYCPIAIAGPPVQC